MQDLFLFYLVEQIRLGVAVVGKIKILFLTWVYKVSIQPEDENYDHVKLQSKHSGMPRLPGLINSSWCTHV